MKIVIELDDETYNRVMASPKVYALNGVDFIGIEKAIYYGTPLPEHHGRLIDADELKKDNEEYIIQCPVRSEDDRQNKMVEWINEDITNAPTIIEGSDCE